MGLSEDNVADTGEEIFIGKGEQAAWLTLAFANRHGLVTGATGTGKTVSLQVMAEGFARAGVPVFAADIKGDLSGIAEIGEAKDFIVKRANELGLSYQPDQFSTIFWDVFGEQGHPVRATVTEMGPLLLSRMLDLNDVQEGVLNVAFRVADENGLALIDMKDLRSLLDAIVPDASKKKADGDDDPLASIRKSAQSFGNVTRATIGTIQRQLLVLENQGGTKFFGEPALTLKDFMRTDRDGRGMINILVADKLLQSPRLYATFLLWMLSELFEELPEVGDLPKPKLVFFFDEAHLLFDDAPKVLMDKIEQVVRLIRSKGSVSISSRRIRSTFPTRCSASSATACSMRSGHLRHAIRRRLQRRRRPFAPIRSSTRPRSSWSWGRARRWRLSWKEMAFPRWSNAS
jgi:DNA helicase HerA-like ATPase